MRSTAPIRTCASSWRTVGSATCLPSPATGGCPPRPGRPGPMPWPLLAMLAHALLVVLAAGEHAAAPPPPGLIPLTCNELQRLLLRRVIDLARRPADPEAWSSWRRRHQYRAHTSHYRRQAAGL